MIATKGWCMLVACAGLLLAAPMAAAQASGARAGIEASQDGDSDDWSSWVQTIEEHAQKLRELRKTEGALQAEVDRAKARRYPRGEERERLFAAHARAQKDLAEAEAQLPELLEQARQAGVPQGLLEDYEDLAEEHPANADDSDDDGDW